MVTSLRYALIFAFLLIPPLQLPAGHDHAFAELHGSNSTLMQRDYASLSRYRMAPDGILLVGSLQDMRRLSRWLDQIFAVPHGRGTIREILASGNRLTIRNSTWALPASGRTLAPVTAGLINGKGEDVEILFDARIPDSGSHSVFGEGNQLIEFTAVQNLFHELAHAKHLTKGTWRYTNSEAQAIDEENLFRAQLSRQHGHSMTTYRVGIKAVQVWHPGSPDGVVAMSN